VKDLVEKNIGGNIIPYTNYGAMMLVLSFLVLNIDPVMNTIQTIGLFIGY
jgi:hypothetical protein